MAERDEKVAPELARLGAAGRRYSRARATLDRLVIERDEAILAAARVGASRASIAAAAGVTVIRVQQVLAAAGAVRPYRRGRGVRAELVDPVGDQARDC